MHLLTTRSETAQIIARDKVARGQSKYSIAMIEAEKIVRALEILGLIRCMPTDTESKR